MFRYEVLTSGAEVYLRRNGSYFIVPCGILEKVDDCWILMTLTMQPHTMLLPPRRGHGMEWTKVGLRALSIQFLYHRSEWKKKVGERLQDETVYLFTMTRRDLENLYDHDWSSS
jgi:hypothetical protein